MSEGFGSRTIGSFVAHNVALLVVEPRARVLYKPYRSTDEIKLQQLSKVIMLNDVMTQTCQYSIGHGIMK